MDKVGLLLSLSSLSRGDNVSRQMSKLKLEHGCCTQRATGAMTGRMRHTKPPQMDVQPLLWLLCGLFQVCNRCIRA